MTILEKEINDLFKLCNETNRVLNQVDMYEQRKYLSAVKNKSIKVFTLMENHVNGMCVKDFNKQISSKNTLLKIYFVIMRGMSRFIVNGNGYFDDDLRSRASSELSQRLFLIYRLDDRVLKCPAWMKNNDIYDQAIVYGLGGLHKTLLQNIVRCLTESLRSSEIAQQEISEYLTPFEVALAYYLVQAPDGERVYLEYI